MTLLAEIVGICLLVCLGTQNAAAEEPRPEPGVLHEEVFVPNFDAVCGIGSKMSEGCDAIRARKIVDASFRPWMAVGRVNFASTQIRQHCTGTLVSERIVLTAAHCLYNFPRKRWISPQSIIFAAGFQRGSAVAVSHGERFILNKDEDVNSRDFRSNHNQDWALLVLQEPIGREVGYLDVLNVEPADLKLLDFKLAGYSSLRPNVLSVASDCGQLLENWPGVLLQRCSAMRGDSGAPLLFLLDGKYVVAGVFSAVVSWGTNFASLTVSTSSFLDTLLVEREQTTLK